ncbi:replication protein [Aggregatibacter actinomycetemcomitans]|uniref:replication protein n=1 Tax=Aggregatibacter actinomycetemcomitans TaxID=714 RepID=UPI002151B657|nr:replication protein [Aggregatibacter actinomycetemcomitans]
MSTDNRFTPNSFQVPNALVDDLMAELGGVELKCYLLVIRKTKGWSKEFDAISLSQFVTFTGAGKTAVINALKNLVDAGLLVRKVGVRNTSVYAINLFRNSTSSESELVQKVNRTSSESELVTSSESEHTKNNIKNTTQNTNTNLTVSNAHARKTSKSTVEILEQFGITGQLAKDFIAHRKVKKSVITETVLNGFQREADKAGIPLVEAITISIERNWQGFRASWNWQDGQQQARKESFAEKNSSDWGSPEKMAGVF